MSLVSWKKLCCATIQLCPLLGKTGFTFCYPLIMNTSMILASCFCFFFYQVNSSNSDNSFLCVAIRQHVLPYDESKLSFEVVLLYFNVLKSIFSLNISCTCIRDTDFPSPPFHYWISPSEKWSNYPTCPSPPPQPPPPPPLWNFQSLWGKASNISTMLLQQQQQIISFLKSLPGFCPNFLDTLPSFKSFPGATGNESLFVQIEIHPCTGNSWCHG